MVTQPRQHVAGPTFTPAPFGLLETLADAVRTPTDQHWRNGVNYEELCAAADTTYEDCFAVSGTGGAAAAPPPAKTPTAALATRAATAFTVYADVDCSVPGFWDRSQELINQTMLRAEGHAVERAFWTGRAADQPVVYPHLAADAVVSETRSGHLYTLQTAATAVTGGPYDVVEGIGRLEAALANCYEGVGVLHVPVSLATALAESMLLVRDGNRYRTPKGNLIVLGGGYTGSSPAGAELATSAYVYATGPLFIYRSNIFTTPPVSAVDRQVNTQNMIAERTYVLGWECCHLAVQISLGGVVAGASGGAGG